MIKENSNNNSTSTLDMAQKILILGETGVGKTQFLSRFVGADKKKISQIFPVIELSDVNEEDTFTIYKLPSTLLADKLITLQLYDIDNPSFKIDDYQAALLIYDITSEKSLQYLYKKWVSKLNKPNFVKMLVGNKSDKESERVISVDKGLSFAHEHGMLFMETSCVDGKNIDLSFKMVLQQLEHKKKQQPNVNEESLRFTYHRKPSIKCIIL